MIRKSFLQIALVALATLAVGGCSPEDDFPEAPVESQLGDKRQKLVGNWQLVKIVQIDEDAKSKGWPLQVQQRTFEGSVTTLLNNGTNETYNLNATTFNFQSNGSYTFARGQLPENLLPVSISSTGTWSFDDNVFTTKVVLSSSGTPAEFSIKSLTADNPPFVMTITRSAKGAAVMSYELHFQRFSN